MKKLILIIFMIFTAFLSAEELFFDDFEGGIGNWTVVNNGGTGVWQIYGPPYPNGYTLPATSSGNVCAADSDETGSGTTTLTTLVLAAPLNLTTYQNIILEFDSDFNAINTNDLCYVDVSVDGNTWTNVLFYNGVDVRNTHETIDISTIANMQSSVYVRFHSIQPGWDWWWAIDNVEITGDLAITYDNDLAALSISGNTIVNAGNFEIYQVTVKNIGNNAQNSYNVKLFKNNVEVATLDVTNPIAPDETVIHNLVWQIPANEPSGVKTLYGKVTLVGDENPANDNTNDLQVRVFPQGVLEVSIGNGTENNNRTPVRFQHYNSLTESLFFPSELGGITGTITSVKYYNDFTSYLTNKPISIWAGQTTLNSLVDGWIPASQLTQVFDGFVTFPSGQNTITIEFDTPYFYSGDNLVLMVHRPMDTANYGTTDYFKHSQTTAFPSRTRYEADNTIVCDPFNPPAGYSFDKFANLTIVFFQGTMGDVEGYVYDDQGGILDNAEVEIEELQMTTYSNNLGFYHFGNVLTGTYDFTANKFSFSPQTIQGEVLEDQTTTIDFNLIPLGVVIVSGHVVGSDYPETGLEGALVSVTGFENYYVMTDGNGDFEITGVYTNITYDMSIVYEGYNTLYDDLVVGGVNLDLGTLILEEMTFPPGNVQAVQNAAQTEVALSWNSPGQGGGEFRYDDGEVDFQIGFSSSPANGVFGAIHPNIAIVQEVQWFLRSIYGAHPNVKILILGLDEDNVPDVGQVYLITNLISNVDDEWNSLILDEEISAPEGFFVGVITPGLYTSVGLDDGVEEPWIFQPDTQMSNENWLAGNNWSDIGDVGSIFRKNMMIRAYGINMGNSSPDDSAPNPNQARSNENQTIAQTFPRFIGINATTQTSSGIDSGNNREFESYNIYRFPFALHNYPASWNLIASAITDTFYTDTSWASLPVNIYQFALTSEHTNGVESVPSFSQALYKTLTPAEPEILPSISQLHDNYPNPFNPTTTISFSTTENTKNTELSIYNLKGQKVKQLLSDQLPAGQHSVVWNGTDESGTEVASGLYFYKMKAGKYTNIKKMLLLK